MALYLSLSSPDDRGLRGLCDMSRDSHVSQNSKKKFKLFGGLDKKFFLTCESLPMSYPQKKSWIQGIKIPGIKIPRFQKNPESRGVKFGI